MSSLWWLHQLGQMARDGQSVVIRQALTGGSYGLIDDVTLEPRPDYYASLLWKQLMGSTVLQTHESSREIVRSFAHCSTDRFAPGAVTLLLINISDHTVAEMQLPDLGPAEIYRATADDPAGVVSTLDQNERLRIAPFSFAFVVYSEAEYSTCL